MRANILNCDKWVKDNQLEEIKNGNMISKNSTEPDPDGLVSWRIFGRPGTQERRRTYAYIDLVDMFLHPHIYYELVRYQRNISDLMSGLTEFYLDPETHKLVKEDKNHPRPKACKHGVGVKFLYDVWNQINFEEPPNCSPATAMRLKFFRSLNREDAFLSKLPVIPAFYRDAHSAGEKVNEINTFYRKFLTNAATIRATSGLFEVFGVSSSDKKIQDTLLEIYNYFIGIVGGSKGFIHKNVMGKSTDYSARAVISMPKYDNDKEEDEEVDFEHSALPLSTCCKCFSPFIKYGIKKIIDRVLAGRKFMWVRNLKTGIIERKMLAPDFMDDFTSDALDKLIELYDDSFDHRYDVFTIRLEDGSRVPLCTISDEEEPKDKIYSGESSLEELKNENAGQGGKRHPITLTELLYMAAYDTVKDKVIYITRYPIEDQHNIYPSLFNIIPTIKTKKRWVMSNYYPRFPVIPKDVSEQEDLNYNFVDSLRVFPSYLKALGGDFDGDQVSIQGIFTEEANEAAKKYINSIMNIVNVSGGTMRELSEVSLTGLYMLTYRYKDNK
ncbi:MAG: hypothetical protein IJ772_04535 [Bacilli bacterium]|nr:hypothetical protein [Bacilli bacterium]